MTTLKQMRREGLIIAFIAVLLVMALFVYTKEAPTTTGAFVKATGMVKII